MSAKEFHSFKEAADTLLSPEDIIGLAWPDIQSVCLQQPHGLRKRYQEQEQDAALTRAIATLQRRYTSSGSFRQSIEGLSLQNSAGITKQILYYFAKKWEQHEALTAVTNTVSRDIAVNVQEMLVLHGKWNAKALTREQLEEIRKRKQQSQASKKRM